MIIYIVEKEVCNFTIKKGAKAKKEDEINRKTVKKR